MGNTGTEKPLVFTPEGKGGFRCVHCGTPNPDNGDKCGNCGMNPNKLEEGETLPFNPRLLSRRQWAVMES